MWLGLLSVLGNAILNGILEYKVTKASLSDVD
jgi:hypothetical protein